jgi:hypothetical protein
MLHHVEPVLYEGVVAMGSSLSDLIQQPDPLEFHYTPGSIESRIYELAETAHQKIKKSPLSREEKEADHEIVERTVHDCLQDPDKTNRLALLKHLAAHTGRHRADTIRETFIRVSFDPEIMLPDEFLDDHFSVYLALDEAYFKARFREGEEGEEVDEYYAVTGYALRHIEDGYLILSLVNERGLGTLREVLSVLPAVKAHGNDALSGGVL